MVTVHAGEFVLPNLEISMLVWCTDEFFFGVILF